MKKYYISTPIYYSNWLPHIWHSYSSLLADTIARFKRLLWYKVKFSTWVDENAQKNVLVAKEKWIWVMEFLDDIADGHKKVWDWINISYTDFIRTTEQRHHIYVKKILQKTFENEDIYQWEYKWLYCVGCEAFKKETDLTSEWLCPDHLKKPEYLIEKNWFFRLKKYQDNLMNFFEQNPNFVYPEFRFNEVKAWFDKWLEDFSISRETNKFWISLPFDETQVAYVWYDALLNYLTVCQDKDEWFWPCDLHVVWKEITRFHAIYWPAMLMSVSISLPKQILVTWFLTIDWQKISKSLWNVIDPSELAKKYTRDSIILYLFSDISIWNDCDFDTKKFKWLYDSTLVWWWGNLYSRICSLVNKNWIQNWELIDSKFEYFKDLSNKSENNKLLDLFNHFDEEILENYIKNFKFWDYIKDWIMLIDLSNTYIQNTKPREKLKNLETKQDWIDDLKFLVYILKNIWLLWAFLFIDWFEKFKQLYILEWIENIKTWKNDNINEWYFQKLFELEYFKISMKEWHLYERILD